MLCLFFAVGTGIVVLIDSSADMPTSYAYLQECHGCFSNARGDFFLINLPTPEKKKKIFFLAETRLHFLSHFQQSFNLTGLNLLFLGWV